MGYKILIINTISDLPPFYYFSKFLFDIKFHASQLLSWFIFYEPNIYHFYQKMLQILENPGDELTGKAAVYGMAQTIPDKSLVSDLAAGFMDIIYSTN